MGSSKEFKDFIKSWFTANLVMFIIGAVGMVLPGINLLAVPTMFLVFFIVNTIFVITSFVKFFENIINII